MSCYRCFGACDCYGVGRGQSEPLSHCSPLELDGEPEGRWRLRTVVAAVFLAAILGAAFSLVVSCAETVPALRTESAMPPGAAILRNDSRAHYGQSTLLFDTHVGSVRAPVSRSYEVCHMACERVGCSQADTTQICAVAEGMP